MTDLLRYMPINQLSVTNILASAVSQSDPFPVSNATSYIVITISGGREGNESKRLQPL